MYPCECFSPPAVLCSLLAAATPSVLSIVSVVDVLFGWNPFVYTAAAAVYSNTLGARARYYYTEGNYYMKWRRFRGHLAVSRPCLRFRGRVITPYRRSIGCLMVLTPSTTSPPLDLGASSTGSSDVITGTEAQNLIHSSRRTFSRPNLSPGNARVPTQLCKALGALEAR